MPKVPKITRASRPHEAVGEAATADAIAAEPSVAAIEQGGTLTGEQSVSSGNNGNDMSGTDIAGTGTATTVVRHAISNTSGSSSNTNNSSSHSGTDTNNNNSNSNSNHGSNMVHYAHGAGASGASTAHAHTHAAHAQASHAQAHVELQNQNSPEAIMERYQRQRMAMTDAASGMEQMTDEQADESYQRILREKNSAKVRKWRKKLRQSQLTEDEKITQAREENDLLVKEKHELTERLCQLNESIAEIQRRRADSLRSQVCTHVIM
jgi:hypothetical protein